MPLYVGLDVSQKDTEICVIDGDGRRTWRGKCPSRPESIAEVLRQHAPDAAKIGMETGPLSIWLWHGLRALGVPVDCIHARHIAAALSLQVNKTDANDARGIAQVVRSGWYRAVGVKSLQSCRVRALLSARSQLVSMRTSLSNHKPVQPNPRLAENLWRGARTREGRLVRGSRGQRVPGRPACLRRHWRPARRVARCGRAEKGARASAGPHRPQQRCLPPHGNGARGWRHHLADVCDEH